MCMPFYYTVYIFILTFFFQTVSNLLSRSVLMYFLGWTSFPVYKTRAHTQCECVCVCAPVSQNHNFHIPSANCKAFGELNERKCQHFSSIIYGIQLSFTVTNPLAHILCVCVCVYTLICRTDRPNIVRLIKWRQLLLLLRNLSISQDKPRCFNRFNRTCAKNWRKTTTTEGDDGRQQ